MRIIERKFQSPLKSNFSLHAGAKIEKEVAQKGWWLYSKGMGEDLGAL